MHPEAIDKSDDTEYVTTCDICGKTIVGLENYINAGDKVVCSKDCLYKAIGEFTRWQNTPSHGTMTQEDIRKYKKGRL